MKKLDIEEYINKKYGKLTIVNSIEFDSKGWKINCLCDCGKYKITYLTYLKRKSITSCGCFHIQQAKLANTKHELCKHPLYKVYHNIKERCYNEKYSRYADWGGRGITVCDKWLEDFMNFYNWAISNGWKLGLQIDRENNNGNYEPDNCKFSTAKENSCNRRSNRNITFNNKTQSLNDWCKELNLKQSTISMRITKYGWTEQEALIGKIEKEKLF